MTEPSFAETALTLGGKSAEESRRTGTIDRADDQVELLFQPQYQTKRSPAYRAIWDRQFPVEGFTSRADRPPPEVLQVMQRSLEIVRERRQTAQLYDSQGRISQETTQALGQAGYWGLLVDRAYGGSGASMQAFARFLTQVATLEPTIAGLASVHGCIGAVDPLRTFGSEEQKRRFLPDLASGRQLSAFALTEPCAGSDLTALRTTARREGDVFLVTGEKLFITNLDWGRTLGLVCLIDQVPSVLICQLPPREQPSCRLRSYGLWALRRTINQGVLFQDFPIPAENLLQPRVGNGLTIAYHGLNLGRVALCANAAGVMRSLLASMIPWVRYRVTYGASIDRRELVRRRLGRLAALIVGCDALVDWCATLLDAGYRGEMECILAKIFGSEALQEAAVELCLKTHGGRSFLQGHLVGDNLHDFLAPCIYEGEGEMLRMAFFKSLVKHHGTQYFEPVGKALQAAGIRHLNPTNPRHLWVLRHAIGPYARWWLRESLVPRPRPRLVDLPGSLRPYAEWSCQRLQHMALEVSGTMRRHQLRLADRQCRMSELSHRAQLLMTMLVTSMYAARLTDQTLRLAARVLCQDLKRELTGRRITDHEIRTCTELGRALAEDPSPLLTDVLQEPILMRYDRNPPDEDQA